MTGAAVHDSLSAMRALLIPSALIAALVAVPAAAQVDTAPLVPIMTEEATTPARLAPIAADSPWRPRFEAAADELASALRSREESRWLPLMGGQWLAAADRDRVAGLLRDRKSPFLHALFAKGFAHRTILGWQPAADWTANQRAEIDARPEAEALVCWSSYGDAESRWPGTAREADNGPDRPYACARIAYSIRGEQPSWRAFIEGPEGAGDPPG